MIIPNTDAIYYFVEGSTAQRIDSRFVEYMHNQGYPIIKQWLDENHTEEWLNPENDIPDDFIQKSEYGMCMMLTKGGSDE